MRLPRPSPFAIISLLILLGLGIAANLVIVHMKPTSRPGALFAEEFSTDAPSPSDPVRWPTIPEEITNKLGTPNEWFQIPYKTYRVIGVDWYGGMSDHRYALYLRMYRFGLPFTARSTKKYFTIQSSDGITPIEGTTYKSESTTYHPLGLILNPIIYALPPWALLLLLRHALLRLRARRRRARGLCPHCAYEVKDLHTCPECGTAV